MSRTSRILTSLLCLLASSSLMGCTTFHSPFAKKLPKATPSDPCVEIVCLWQPGEGRDPDGVPCKGFMGQILFLSRSSSTPVQIEGDVRVYLFDDQGTPEEQARPLRQFDFDHGSWGVHLSDSSFGPTYSVFIPYVRRGVSNAACALRVRLKQKFGPTVFSDITNMNLDGHTKRATGPDAQPLTTEEVDLATADAMAKSLTRTTTISTGPNPKVTEAKPVAKKHAQAQQIQLASHEEPSTPPKESAEADRIQKLEAMVQQLLDQKANSAITSPAPAHPLASPRYTHAGVEPAPLNPQSAEPLSAQDDSHSSRRMKLRRSTDDEPSQPLPRRRVHPLDDELTPPARSNRDEEFARDSRFGDSFETSYEDPSSQSELRYRRASR